MTDHAGDAPLLSTKQAADYLGMTRQALTLAAERGEVGRKVEAIGRNPPYVYRFARSELDVWAAREKSKGGRPKKGKLGAGLGYGEIEGPED